MTLAKGGAAVKAKFFNKNHWAFNMLKGRAARYASRFSAVPGGMINGT